ncbi:MAG: ABC transporter substrate-binding protein [Gammaproteobacteria bacterium]
MALAMVVLGSVCLGGCSKAPWNDPYPAADARANVLYSAFSERPKHLDPARAYNANEYEFISQIYEPPLQYQYLKRPYQLVPLTATRMPRAVYLDHAGRPLPADTPPDQIAYTVYEIHIKPGILYQPHPAFARDASGRWVYRPQTPGEVSEIDTLSDFHATGTRELVAADYVYEIKRLADPELHSPIYGLMSGYIVGLRRLAAALQKARNSQPKGYLDLNRYPLEGAQVVNRYTYRIKIRGKYPQFLYWLAMPFFAPVPPEVVRFYAQPGLAERNISLDWYPVGTGPYMLTENNPNRRMVLSRNPNFHHETYPREGAPGDREQGLLADAGRPLPFVNRVVFSLEKESIPYWTKFLQGYYDVSGISSDSFDQAVQIGGQGQVSLTPAMKAKGIALRTSVAPAIYYMGFNMLDPTVGGYSEAARKLRQAISIAVNYEEYVAIFRNGRGIAAQGPLPPGIFGYRQGPQGIDRYVYDWKDGRPQRKTVADARNLLAQAGYPGGVDRKTGVPLILYLDIASNSGPDEKALLDWYRKQFAKLGIQLVVRSTFYNRFQDKMQKGTEQIFLWGWTADYPDPENFLFLLYGPNGKVEHGGENAANYQNPAFDRLFDQMKNMDNGPGRQAVIDRMVRIADRDAPWVWGFHPKEFRLYHAWDHNVKPNLMANNTLKYIRIDPDLRAKLRRRWNRPVLWPLLALLALVALFTLPALATYLYREHRRPGGSAAD